TDKKIENVRQGHEVGEGDAGEKEKNSGEEEAGDGAALVLIESRRYEEPHLVQDDGRSHYDAEVDAELDQQAEVVGGAGVDELIGNAGGGERVLDWDGNDFDEVGSGEPAYGGTDAGGDQRIDDALAELDEMLKKSHLPARTVVG